HPAEEIRDIITGIFCSTGLRTLTRGIPKGPPGKVGQILPTLLVPLRPTAVGKNAGRPRLLRNRSAERRMARPATRPSNQLACQTVWHSRSRSIRQEYKCPTYGRDI